MKPVTRNKKGKGLEEALAGELSAYEKAGLFARSVTSETTYRYRGVLLQYQRALQGRHPSPESSLQFLARLRQDGFKPATLRLYRAALQGFHTWRGEQLVFPVKVPHHLPEYHSAELINRVLSAAKDNPRDNLILRLMSDAGLRRSEVVSLRVRNADLDKRMLRVRGKGDKDRVIPMTKDLHALLDISCRGRGPDASVVGVKDKAIYTAVKKWAAAAGAPTLHPHDFRHAFATRLIEGKANIKAVQELMGHTDLATTAVYLGVSPRHLEEAIRLLDTKQPDLKVPGLLPNAKSSSEIRHSETQQVQVIPGRGRYVAFDIPEGEILIDSVVVRPHDSGSNFEFLLLDRRQTGEFPIDEDVVHRKSSTGERITWAPGSPVPYRDNDKSNHIHFTLTVSERHVRFDLDDEALEEYLHSLVVFDVTLTYRTL